VENNSTYKHSELSPTIWAERSFPLAPTFLAALAAIPVAILPAFVYSMYLIGAKIIPPHATLTQIPVRLLLISQLLSYIPLIAYLLVVVPALASRSLAELGVRMPTKREVLIGLQGTLLMWVIVALSSSLLTSITHEHQTEAAMQLLRELHTPLDTVLFIAIAVFCAPIMEEFAFRVFLFNAISRYTSRTIGAIGSGVLFGLVHGSGVSVIVPLALGGIVLARVYMKSGCYWSDVITHGLFNAAGVIAVLVFHASD
jgi:membrane protease YdiL (CAAX protease family)